MTKTGIKEWDDEYNVPFYNDFAVMAVLIGMTIQGLIILTIGWNQPGFWRLW